MWDFVITPKATRDFKKLQKRHEAALTAGLINLDKLLEALGDNVPPIQWVRYKFVHKERKGVYAIDSRPKRGKGHIELRIYVYPDTSRQDLHVISAGGKETQSQDIREAHDYAATISGD